MLRILLVLALGLSRKRRWRSGAPELLESAQRRHSWLTKHRKEQVLDPEEQASMAYPERDIHPRAADPIAVRIENSETPAK
jgi:hypothetical protein